MRNFFLGILIAVAGGCSSCQHPGEGKPSAADSASMKQMNDPQIKAITEKISKDPGNPDNYFARGEIFIGLNNLKSAFADVSKAISLDSTRADFYFTLADIYLKGGGADGAAGALSKIIRLLPDSVEAYIRLSKVYYYQKQYSQSLNELNSAEAIDHLDPEIFFVRGMNFKEMGDTVKAMVAFQKAVTLQPDNYDAYMQLGLLGTKKKNQQAPAYFDNAIRLDSTRTEAYYGKAMYFQNQKDFEKAKQTYRDLINRDPQYEHAYFNLGFIFITQDSVAQAYKMFDLAIKVSPQYAEAYYYRGLCEEEMGKKDEAKMDFQQAVNLKPDYEAPQKELKALEQK